MEGGRVDDREGLTVGSRVGVVGLAVTVGLDVGDIVGRGIPSCPIEIPKGGNVKDGGKECDKAS